MVRLVFTFVRHGETQDNRNGILAGHLNTPLNSLGRRQAAAVALCPALKKTPFAYALASDLSRAIDTAEAILKHHPSLSLVTSRRLREKHFGNAEGRPFGTKVRNSGESFGEFRKRCIGWWKETVAELMGLNATQEDDADKVIQVLVISHGGFIRVLLESLVSYPDFHFGTNEELGSVPNTGVSIVEAVGVYDGHILRYGDDAHLEGIVESDDEVKALEESQDRAVSLVE